MDLRGQSLRLRQQALEAAPLLLEAAWIWLRAYLTGREPVMRMSTSFLALCCQSGPEARLETPISARSRSIETRSLRMSPLLIARFTNSQSLPESDCVNLHTASKALQRAVPAQHGGGIGNESHDQQE